MSAKAPVFSHPIPLIDTPEDGYIEQFGWIEAIPGLSAQDAHERLVGLIGADAMEGIRPTGVVTGPHHLVPLLYDAEADRDFVVLPGRELTITEEESIRWRLRDEFPAAALSFPFWKIEYESVD